VTFLDNGYKIIKQAPSNKQQLWLIFPFIKAEGFDAD